MWPSNAFSLHKSDLHYKHQGVFRRKEKRESKESRLLEDLYLDTQEQITVYDTPILKSGQVTT